MVARVPRGLSNPAVPGTGPKAGEVGRGCSGKRRRTGEGCLGALTWIPEVWWGPVGWGSSGQQEGAPPPWTSEPKVSLSVWNKATCTCRSMDSAGPSGGRDVFTFFKPNSGTTGWRTFRAPRRPGAGSWKRGEGRESGEGCGAGGGLGLTGLRPNSLPDTPGSANWALCLSFLRARGPVRNRASLLGLVKG